MEQYVVALSFAGPQRTYVEQVASALQARGVAVFYDEFESVALWGQDATEAFHEVYSSASYVVMFISRDYVERAMPRHEKRSALSRAMQERREYVLPVRFDDTPLRGLPSSVIYERADEQGPVELAAKICQKLGVGPFSGKADQIPPPRMTSPTGEAVSDYSNHDGRYVIGGGTLQFETKWSKASDERIYLLNDPPSINGVALARNCASIHQVTNAEALDYTSRTRSIPQGRVAVLRNTHGFYAAVQIIEIKDDTRGHDRDELRFRYAIQADGSGDFGVFSGI